MSTIYTEENGRYTLDCTSALWSTDRIHNYYQGGRCEYGCLGFLKDVDFAIESEKYIILVEYKNAKFSGASNPTAFNPIDDNSLISVARKFFDSLHYLFLEGKEKPKKYVYIVEFPNDNSSSRLLLQNKLKDKLPFTLQSKLDGNKQLIEEVKVLNISEWNADPELGAYPISLIEGSTT